MDLGRVSAVAVIGVAIFWTMGVQGQDPNARPPEFLRIRFELKSEGRTESTVPVSGAASRLGGGWTISQTPDGAFEAVRERARTELDVSVSVGAAWGAAHALRQDPAVEFAEPQFLVTSADGEQTGPFDCMTAITESSIDPTNARHIRGALDDPEWSLGERGANVREAWHLMTKAGRQPGAGVVVAHPDTGYRRHPEIWSAVPGQSAIHPADGWDFFAGRPDPFDDLTDGFLKNPGHGTRTASVIVSPPGSQRPGSRTWVTGVAPAAHLIPLRVTDTVSMLDMSRLAEAVRHASGDDRSRVKRKADVISISLGGPPSRSLRHAIADAYQRNVIVVAAAGNAVRTVVWPARYDGAIAVAASNFDSATWSGSSRGRSVIVTAPGETVWCASTIQQDPNTNIDCLAVSNGTSFATATTAGVAALWLSHHAGTPALEALRREGAVAWAFAELVRQGVRRIDNWDSGSYGPGILDARKLLELPVPPPPPGGMPPAPSGCRGDLETVESLFDAAPDPRARVDRLLRPSGGEPLCVIAFLGDEVAFHYATEPVVQAAIEKLAQAGDPADSDYQAAREALLASDVSPQLRDALTSR